MADIPCVKLPPFLAERRERGELALHGSFLSNCRETPALTGLPFSGIIPNNVIGVLHTMTEQYEQLANELVQVNEALLHQPAQDLLSKLSRGEHFVLNYLLTHYGQAHPTDLSRHMVVSTARIAALLNRMEEKGLISRLPDPLDNRQIIVSLSPKGEKAIEAFRKKVIQATARMLELLGPDDSQEFLRLQRKLVTNLIPR